MSRCPTINFQLWIISKWHAKHISTKVSIKITIRKRYVNNDIRWLWIWNQYFYLGIWNDDRTKIIVFPSFQIATRLSSQNSKETEFINEHWHINLYMNIGISNWNNSSFEPTKMTFLLYFISLHDYWGPCTWKSLVHTSWSKWCDVKKFFSDPQNVKNKISWNIKPSA